MRNHPTLLLPLRSGLAAKRHPFGDGLHYANAANQTQHEKPIIQFGLPSKALLEYILIFLFQNLHYQVLI